jgi:hypothetical protein
MPIFYNVVAENIETDVIEVELKEIADYTSNTIENLYFLVNSTNSLDVSLEKELIYLPSNVEHLSYVLEIVELENTTTRVVANLKDNPSVQVYSWLIPGLKVSQNQNRIESSERTVIVGCNQNATGIYVWIKDA